MAAIPGLKSLLKAVHSLSAVKDPLDRVAVARRVADSAGELERALVAAARKAGCTWAEIGEQFGMSKQAAQQRYREPSTKKPAKG